MEDREYKTMQVNLRIFQEDENNRDLKKIICDIVNAANDKAISVEKISLEGKELFSLENGWGF